MAKIVYKCEVCGKIYDDCAKTDECCSGMQYCNICGKGYKKDDRAIDVCCIEDKILEGFDLEVYKNFYSCWIRVEPNYQPKSFISKDFMNIDDAISIIAENKYGDEFSIELSVSELEILARDLNILVSDLIKLSIKKEEEIINRNKERI